MKDIMKYLAQNKMIFQYYHEAHKNQFELMSFLYQQSISNNSPKKSKQILNKLVRDHKYSYKDVITLFELILNYHSGNIKVSEQKMILNQFNEIAAKFKYTLFNEAYLINYFQKK
jgi:hypothetical protein